MRENSTEYDRAILLLAKKVGSVATPEELDELAAMLVAKPDLSFLAEVVSSLKGNVEHVEKSLPGEELSVSGWANLSEQMNQRRVGVRRVRMRAPVRRILKWSVAAAVVMVLGLASVVYLWRPRLGTATVEFGGKKMLVLADGTKVWLNAGSRLDYPVAFEGKTREVSLEGEAFFDVAKKEQPFFVHTTRITVRVLGTQFDLKAYLDDPQVAATLISGKIKVVFNDDPEKEILLSPHEKLTVVNSAENELRFQVKKSEVAPEMAWVEDKLVFNDEPFGEVARKLERRYNVHIEFDNEALKQQHVSGVFEREGLEQALEILQMTTQFNYKVEGPKLRLW